MTLTKKFLKGRDLVSISDLSKQDIELILSVAKKWKQREKPNLLKGKILASCFFEPSTRTRLSFEAAMHRLGGSVIGFSDTGTTSVKKGETLFDTMKVVGSYADIVVIRHPEEGAANLAALATNKPVINAGDGSNEHPTQTLIDLFTIQECQGKIDNLQIAIAGDLKYGRTIHSLCLALANYAVHLHFISDENLMLPEEILSQLKKGGVPISFHKKLDAVIPKVDILYMSRIQRERIKNIELSTSCQLKLKQLERAKKNLRILHPLPRVGEIDERIDETDYAAYFLQAANGVPIRMALLALLLG